MEPELDHKEKLVNRNELTEQTKQIFNNFLDSYYGYTEPEYANDENVVDKFGLDSLDIAGLTFEFEEGLEVEIPDCDLQYKTINEFVDAIDKLIK